MHIAFRILVLDHLLQHDKMTRYINKVVHIRHKDVR